MYTVGKMSKQFKISRSTLLYYDKIGLLKPSGRSESNYRLYSDNEVERLKLIIQHREAGIPLDDIAKLFDVEKNSITDILTDRLKCIQGDIKMLKKQESMILSVLIETVKKGERGTYNKESWTALLLSLGFTSNELIEWHRSFEQSSSKEHSVFLQALGMSNDEIKTLKLSL